MSAHHKAVLFALVARLPNRSPTTETLQQDAGTSRSNLFRVLKDLETWGMLRRIPMDDGYGGRATNIYELDPLAIRYGGDRTG